MKPLFNPKQIKIAKTYEKLIFKRQSFEWRHNHP